MNLAGNSRLSSAADTPIPTDVLVGPLFRDFTKAVIQDDQVLDIYLHRNGGAIEIQGGTYGAQFIDAIVVDQELESYIGSIVKRLDSSLAIGFRFVDSPDQADVSIYLDSVIKLGDFGATTLGIALSNQVNGRLSWEIVLNGSALAGKIAYRHYAVIHEFLHVLGLEHPFDNSDEDFWISTDYQLSAFPDETVMAYRRPRVGDWPSWISPSDLAALRSIWGEEPVNRIQGGRRTDVLVGTLEADELRGGLGANQFTSPVDEIIDWLVITPDRRVRSGQATKNVDVITELGANDEIVFLGVRNRDLEFRDVSLPQSRFGALQGTGIYVSNQLQAVYTGDAFNTDFISLITSGVPRGFVAPL